MISIIVTVGAGAVSGALAGGVVTWRAGRRHRRPVPAASPTSSAIDSVDDGLDQVATRWAESHGQPMAAPLVARKLRLARRLVAHSSGRWSR